MAAPDPSLPRLPPYLLERADGVPLVDPYSINVQRRQHRTDFEGGAARVRNLSRRPIYEVTVGFRMTRSAYVFWTRFFQVTTAYGAAWCVIPLACANGMFNAECRMKDAPRDAPLGSMAGWDVSLTLEVRNWPTASERDQFAQLPGIADNFNRLHRDVNVVIPGKPL